MNKRTIEIDGRKYWLDVAKATEIGILEPYKVRFGQYYERDGNLYIVSIVGFEGKYCGISLISMNDGGRYVDAVKVKDTVDISEEEWSKITGGEPHRFIQAKNVKIKYDV